MAAFAFSYALGPFLSGYRACFAGLMARSNEKCIMVAEKWQKNRVMSLFEARRTFLATLNLLVTARNPGF
jgi:hypothetical protein